MNTDHSILELERALSAQVSNLRAQLEAAEHNLEAVKVTLSLLPEMGAKIPENVVGPSPVQPPPPKTADAATTPAHGEVDAVVRAGIKAMPEVFSSIQLEKLVHSTHPHFLDSSIRSVLRRMVSRFELDIAEAGKGRRATRYRRQAAAGAFSIAE